MIINQYKIEMTYRKKFLFFWKSKSLVLENVEQSTVDVIKNTRHGDIVKLRKNSDSMFVYINFNHIVYIIIRRVFGVIFSQKVPPQ